MPEINNSVCSTLQILFANCKKIKAKQLVEANPNWLPHKISKFQYNLMVVGLQTSKFQYNLVTNG